MTDTLQPIRKFSPRYITSKKDQDFISKSFTLDLQFADKDHQSKSYFMHFSFIMNGKYTLSVVRRTKDFSRSSFQCIIASTEKIQTEIDKMEINKGKDFTVVLEKYERVFELNFSEIHRIEVTKPNKLTIIGKKNEQNYIVRQYIVEDYITSFIVFFKIILYDNIL